MVIVAIVVSSITIVSLIRAVPVHADTTVYSNLGYPDSGQNCEHSPYTPLGTNAQGQQVIGVANYCSNYDWGPTPDTTKGWTEPDSWSSRGYGYRNCTDYVAWKEGTIGVSVPRTWGNGGDWYSSAPTSEQSTTPAAWDAAVKPSTWANGKETDPGHVAFVESVNSDGTITVSEYNHDAAGDGDTWTGPPSDRGFTEFVDFGVHPAGSGGGGSTGGSINWSGTFATSWGSGRLDAFTWGASNSVSHLWYGGGWGPWDSMPVLSQQATSWPSAVSWGPGRIDVFARGNPDHLLHAWYDSTGWHNWEDLGHCITGAPGVASWGVGRLDVFAQGCGDNGTNLWHVYYDGSNWNWETLPVTGYQMASAPSAVSWGVGRIDVFAQSTSNGGRPIQAYFDSSGWHGWVPLGDTNTCITGAPGVSTWGVNRLDLFTQGCGDNGTNLWHAYFDGSWHWETITPTQPITTSPSAVSWGPGRIDVFAGSASGTLLHRYWDSTGWHNWEDKGGSLAG
jgi:surface antigen